MDVCLLHTVPTLCVIGMLAARMAGNHISNWPVAARCAKHVAFCFMRSTRFCAHCAPLNIMTR